MSFSRRGKEPIIKNKRQEKRHIKSCVDIMNAKTLSLATAFFDFAESNGDALLQQHRLEDLNSQFLKWLRSEKMFNYANFKDCFMRKVCDGLEKHNAIAAGKGILERNFIESKFIKSIDEIPVSERPVI